MKTFINSIKHKLTYPIRELKTIHEHILQMNLLTEKQEVFKNPYQELTEWFLDILQYGFLFAFSYFIFVGEIESLSQMILYVFGFGIIRWLILSFLKDIKETLR